LVNCSGIAIRYSNDKMFDLEAEHMRKRVKFMIIFMNRPPFTNNRYWQTCPGFITVYTEKGRQAACPRAQLDRFLARSCYGQVKLLQATNDARQFKSQTNFQFITNCEKPTILFTTDTLLKRQQLFSRKRLYGHDVLMSLQSTSKVLLDTIFYVSYSDYRNFKMNWYLVVNNLFIQMLRITSEIEPWNNTMKY
jgi:hypothetical protein